MDTLGKLSIVSGKFAKFGTELGQVTSRGALFGQDALQLISNNIPLLHLGPKFEVFLWKETLEESIIVISAERLPPPHGPEYAQT